ncbi:MAG: inositol monophosphatase [Pseudomonadota bacterium]
MSSILIDPNTVLEAIKEIAADKIEPRFQSLASKDIKTKTSPSDLVTIADIEAEQELECFFEDLIPGSIALGEEAISRNEKSIEQLNDDGTYWVIDPVDGTHNFAHGKPVFGTMVALVHKGETVQSWIYDIPGKRAAMAEKGAGASLNAKTTAIPDANAPLTDIQGYISTRFAPKEIRKEVDSKRDQLGSIDALFCCAHEYLNIFEGTSKYAVYTRTKPWDHLPGALILNEAGGYLRKWDDSEYGPQAAMGGILAASDKNIWNSVHELFLHEYIEDKKIFS